MNSTREAAASCAASTVDMQAARASRPPRARVAAVRSARNSALPVWLAWTTSQSAAPPVALVRARRLRQMPRHMAR